MENFAAYACAAEFNAFVHVHVYVRSIMITASVYVRACTTLLSLRTYTCRRSKHVYYSATAKILLLLLLLL